MTAPAFKVEMAFGSGYSTPAASRTWTDITAYAHEGECSIGFGRGDEFSAADANSLGLPLNNTDGRFTPGNTAGAYYPDIKIGVPVRVTSTPSGGSDSVRFTGYVDEWPLEWPGGSADYSVVRISARSRMARLGLSAPLGNLIYEEYRRTGSLLVAHYMLNNLADAAGGGPLEVRGSGADIAFNATGPGTDGIQAAQFAGGKWLESPGGLGGSSIWTIEFFMVTATVSQDVISFTNGGIPIAVDGSGKLDVNGGALVSTTTVSDGLLHHVSLTASGATWRLNVDGVEEDFATVLSFNVTDVWIGRGYTGTLAHVGVHDTETQHADAGLTGFEGETAEARIDRYAAYAGIPTAEVSSDAGADTPMAHIDTTGQALLEMLRRVEQTDGGVLYDARDGTLTYASRGARYTVATAITLQAQQVEVGVVPKLDRTALVNEVTATVADGSDPQETVTAVSETSQDSYGVAKQDIELATTDADEAHAAAWWRVNTYSEPRPRIPSLTVALETFFAADQATLLGLTVGSRIKVENWPSQVGTAYADGFFVEGCNETIGPGFHRLEFNVSPATGFDVWTIEDPVYGQYDAYGLAY